MTSDKVTALDTATMDTVSSLFPHKLFIAGHMWTPYESSAEGIKEALKFYNYALISTMDNVQSGISFASTIPIKLGIGMQIYYYGNDVEDLKLHMVRQLVKCLDSMQEPGLVLAAHFPESIDTKLVSDFLETLGFQFDPLLTEIDPNQKTIIIREQLK